MDSETRRLLSNNILLQLAASDPTPMAASGLYQGARVQTLLGDQGDIASVLNDLAEAQFITEVPQPLVKELKLYRINTNGRAHLSDQGFRMPERRR